MAPAKIKFRDLANGIKRDGIRAFSEYFYYDQNDDKVRWPTDRIKIRDDLVDTTRILDFEILSQYDFFCRFEKAFFRYDRFLYLVQRPDYDGPKIISEGDSWHLYPIIVDEIIDHLLWPDADKPIAVWSTDCAGDTLEHIWIHRKDAGEYLSELVFPHDDYRIMLLSGGGNDLLHSGLLYTMLNDYSPGMTAEQLINDLMFESKVSEIMNYFDNILGEMKREFPSIHVLTHGYDYPISKNDIWIGKPLQRRGIVDPKLQREVIKVFMDRYNEKLARTVGKYRGSATYVDLRGTVPDPNDWHDEIHPSSKGFAAISKIIRKEIDKI
jgi:hypothetical protein